MPGSPWRPPPSRDADAIVRAIDALHTDGSTNAKAGLELGYKLAAGSFREEGINRVMLALGRRRQHRRDGRRVDPGRISWDASLGIQL